MVSILPLAGCCEPEVSREALNIVPQASSATGYQGWALRRLEIVATGPGWICIKLPPGKQEVVY